MRRWGWLLVWLSPAWAAAAPWTPKAWSLEAGLETSHGAYAGSRLRDSASHWGAFTLWEYLERSAVRAAFGRSRVNFKQGIAASVQDEWSLSGQVHEYSDALAGRLTVRLDGYYIDSRDSDEVAVLGARLAWLDRRQRAYVDGGYSASRYGGVVGASADRLVDQITATVAGGGAINWLQLRAFLLYPGESLRRRQGHRWLGSLEGKWFHYFPPGIALKPQYVTLSAVVGERQYAVDPDSYTVYNLSDLQTTGLQAGLQWDLGGDSRVLVMTGTSHYHNHALDDRYSHAFMFLELAKRW